MRSFLDDLEQIITKFNLDGLPAGVPNDVIVNLSSPDTPFHEWQRLAFDFLQMRLSIEQVLPHPHAAGQTTSATHWPEKFTQVCQCNLSFSPHVSEAL